MKNALYLNGGGRVRYREFSRAQNIPTDKKENQVKKKKKSVIFTLFSYVFVMSLIPLKDRIHRTIQALEVRLSYLESKYREFEDLQSTLKKNPENLTVDNKVKLCIGENWFVEQSVEDSLGFVGRRIRNLSADIKGVNDNLESARKAIDDLEKLGDNGQITESEGEDVNTQASSGGNEEDGDTTEDGLPLMDIREELDEDGNVIESSVEPQRKDNDFQEFAQHHLSKIIQSREENPGEDTNKGDYDSEGYKLIDGQRVYGPPKPPPSLPPASSTQEPKSILKKTESNTNKIDGEINSKTSRPPIDRPPTSLKNYVKEVRKQEKEVPQENSSRISEVEEDIIEEKQPKEHSEKSNQVEEDLIEESSKQQPQAFKQHTASIDTEDMIQLEMIADHITENEEDLRFDDGGWDEEFEEDDHDEDYEEDEYGRSIVDYNLMSMEELEKRTKAAEVAAAEARDGNPKSDKKQVRFSSEVEIKRFDKTKTNINDGSSVYESGVLSTPATNNENNSSEEVLPKKKKMSRFKAERLEEQSVSKSNTGPEKTVSPSHLKHSAPVNDILEREAPVSSTAAAAASPINDISNREAPVVEKRPSAAVNDVLEREAPVANKQPSTAAPVSDVLEKDPPLVNGIKDKEPQANKATTYDSSSKPVRNIFKTKPIPGSARQSSQIPPRGKTVAPTPVPGLTSEEVITPVQSLSDKEQIDVTVDQMSSSMEHQKTDLFSKDVFDLAREHFRDSIVTEEQFLQAHDKSDDEDEDDNVVNPDTEEKNRPVLTPKVVEHESQPPPQEPIHFDGVASDDEEDFNVDFKQVSAEYHRIRNKLIQKTGGFKQTEGEKEIEQVDEDGNPIKVSRFKAARLSSRNV